MNQEKCCENCKGYPDGDYGQCSKCHRMIAHSPSPKERVIIQKHSQLSVSNYYAVGQTKECGACNPKYRDCRDITAEYPNITCDCICHSPKEEIVNDWEDVFDKEFKSSWNDRRIMNDISKNDIKSFIKSLLSSTEKKVAKEIIGEIKKDIKKLSKQKTYFDDRPAYFVSDINRVIKSKYE